jgi:thioredoxin 1
MNATIDTLPGILANNRGLVVIKFGASWCGPCRRIEPRVYEWFNRAPLSTQIFTVDVDDDSRLYSYFLKKRLIRGIPAIIIYQKGNTSMIFDDIVNNSDIAEIDAFFGKWFR